MNCAYFVIVVVMKPNPLSFVDPSVLKNILLSELLTLHAITGCHLWVKLPLNNMGGVLNFKTILYIFAKFRRNIAP